MSQISYSYVPRGNCCLPFQAWNNFKILLRVLLSYSREPFLLSQLLRDTFFVFFFSLRPARMITFTVSNKWSNYSIQKITKCDNILWDWAKINNWLRLNRRNHRTNQTLGCSVLIPYEINARQGWTQAFAWKTAQNLSVLLSTMSNTEQTHLRTHTHIHRSLLFLVMQLKS